MRLLLLPLVLFTSLASAQSWCPPGATWTFGYNDVLGGVIGHARVDYTADTLLAGLPAQRLEVRVNAYSYPTQSYWTEYYFDTHFTSGTNDVVQIWNASEQEFDTLYWFNAVPGDRWSVPWSYGTVADFIVLDTLSTTIDGLDLRQVVVGLDVPSPQPIDTLTERLGFRTTFINAVSQFILDQPISGLRCYQDNDIQWNNPTWSFGCASILSVHNQRSADPSQLHPNPGTTHFTLSLQPGPHTISLFDATGRMVLEQRTAEERPVIGTERLPSGMYTVRVVNRNGTVHHHQWIKS